MTAMRTILIIGLAVGLAVGGLQQVLPFGSPASPRCWLSRCNNARPPHSEIVLSIHIASNTSSDLGSFSSESVIHRASRRNASLTDSADFSITNASDPSADPHRSRDGQGVISTAAATVAVAGVSTISARKLNTDESYHSYVIPDRSGRRMNTDGVWLLVALALLRLLM
jgi:hypothetical protein